jgi:translation initiation factor IF-2
MDDDELLARRKEKAKIQELFRDDVIGYFPLIIKSSQAGSLETLLTEAYKIIGDTFKVQIISTGVGPLTEKDLNEAH